jgi:hypothetical protein
MQVRDIRILRYSASIEEIKTLVDKGDSWFKWRASVRNNEGIVSNRGSWEVSEMRRARWKTVTQGRANAISHMPPCARASDDNRDKSEPGSYTFVGP